MNSCNQSWVILAGGRSSRMGGEDKGLIDIDGQPMIAYIYQALKVQTQQIIINANRNIESYQQFAQVVTDLIPDHQGPLAGIYSCLSSIERDWIGFVPCDSPNIPDDLVARFTHSLANNTKLADIDAFVAFDGKYQQPVFSMWNRKAKTKLQKFLQQGDRKMKLFFEQCNIELVDFSDIPQTFINLNTQQQLVEHRNLLAK